MSTLIKEEVRPGGKALHKADKIEEIGGKSDRIALEPDGWMYLGHAMDIGLPKEYYHKHVFYSPTQDRYVLTLDVTNNEYYIYDRDLVYKEYEQIDFDLCEKKYLNCEKVIA